MDKVKPVIIEWIKIMLKKTTTTEKQRGKLREGDWKG